MVPPPDPEITMGRDAIIALRLQTNGLVDRSPLDPEAVRAAAWAGCQDSMPRAAVLSLHARLAGVETTVLDRADLSQVWGPGFSAYVVPSEDTAIFTLGRLPETGARRRTAFELAEALRPILADGPIAYRAAGTRLGVDPNQLRYAALTGTVALHWAGAGAPEISALPDPTIEPHEAALELGRRFLHVYGPATVDDFAKWAGVTKRHSAGVFAGLADEVVSVAAPFGPAVLMWSDAQRLDGADDSGAAGVRLLPSGDAYYLLHGPRRETLVGDADRRAELWTSRVWPGAILLDGTIVGTWRRSATTLTASPWRRLGRDDRERVEASAAELPLPEPVSGVTWESAG